MWCGLCHTKSHNHVAGVLGGYESFVWKYSLVQMISDIQNVIEMHCVVAREVIILLMRRCWLLMDHWSWIHSIVCMVVFSFHTKLFKPIKMWVVAISCNSVERFEFRGTGGIGSIHWWVMHVGWLETSGMASLEAWTEQPSSHHTHTVICVW